MKPEQLKCRHASFFGVLMSSTVVHVDQEIVAHNLLFPWMYTSFGLAKMPPPGTGPSRSLKDRFRICKELSDSKSSGILPDKIFCERSTKVMPFKLMKESGMLPYRLFASKWSDSKRWH